jgi:hypothetical protein
MNAVDLIAQTSARSAQRTLREPATRRVRCADLSLLGSLMAGVQTRAELTAFFAPYQKDFGTYVFDREEANAR